MSKTENLTIMFTDMVGFTEITSRQSRAQNKSMLQQHDYLMLPVIAQFGGRRIKSIGDALLITFRSPTDAVRCGMALHDKLAEFNAGHLPAEEMHIRVAINVGEVRVEGKDVFGEPVNVAARVESVTPADQIYFTEAVYLAMNKAEVPCESVGIEKLKGIPEPVKLFRVPSHNINRLVPGDENLDAVLGEFPYGGMHKLPPEKKRVGAFVETLRQMPPHKVLVASLQRIPLGSKWSRAGLVGFISLMIIIGYATFHMGISGGNSTAHSDNQASDAFQILQQGNNAFSEGNRQRAMQYYDTALKMNSELQNDPVVANNLVGGLSWASDLAIPLIRKYPSPNVINQLARRAVQPGSQGRRRATKLLDELGYSDKIDQTLLALIDLNESRKCEDKVAVIQRLKKLNDVRALPALRSIKGEGIKGWWTNRCLRNEADEAIEQIEQHSVKASQTK